MTHTTSSLETFDFLELLYMLSEQGKSGALTIHRPDGQFRAWLEEGQVMHLQFGEAEGTEALVRLLLEPRGRFRFTDGEKHPHPKLEVSLDEVALEALEALELAELPFDGPARLIHPERVSRIRWSMREQDILQQVEAQRPVTDINTDPEARHLLKKLFRIGLLVPRKSRLARLTVVITRQVTGVVLVDEKIVQRWKGDIIRQPQYIAVRTEDGLVYQFPMRSTSNISNYLLVPPDLLMRSGLHAGDSVLVRPV